MVYELELNNNAEIYRLIPKSKCQYRFHGKSKLDFGKEASFFWDQPDDHSKRMWCWPKPFDKFSFDKTEQVFSKKKQIIHSIFH